MLVKRRQLGEIDVKDLNDVPQDYSGYAGNILKVNSTENGFEFATVGEEILNWHVHKQQTFIATQDQTDFQLLFTPVDDSDVKVYLNGVKQEYDLNYTISGDLVIWLDVPYTIDINEKILVEYEVWDTAEAEHEHIQEVFMVTAALETAFVLANEPKFNSSVKVYVNGVKYELNIDYTTTTSTVTWISPLYDLEENDEVSVEYEF